MMSRLVSRMQSWWRGTPELAGFVHHAFALVPTIFALLVFMGATGVPAHAQTTAAPEIEQRLGARIPAGLKLFDASGTQVDWNVIAASGRPIVLLPAYYRCRTLCGTVAHGALEALADTGLAPSTWQLLLFSVDPQDRPADARVLQAVYADYAAWARPAVYGTPPDLRLLTGPASDTRALARTIGFDWIAPDASPDAGDPQFAHATGLVVLTPDGVVSRYLLGVRFEPSTLRAAIVEASQGRVGTLTDRLLLACSHFDPLPGSHDGLVLALARAVALLVLGALGFWIWRHRAAPKAVPR